MSLRLRRAVLALAAAVLVVFASFVAPTRAEARERTLGYGVLDLHRGYGDTAERTVVVSLWELDDVGRLNWVVRPKVKVLDGHRGKFWYPRLKPGHRYEVLAADSETGKIVRQRFTAHDGEVYQVPFPVSASPSKDQQIAALIAERDAAVARAVKAEDDLRLKVKDLVATQEQSERYRQQVTEFAVTINVQTVQIADLQARLPMMEAEREALAALFDGSYVPDRGLSVGVGPASGRLIRGPFDRPAVVAFHNASYYRIRIGLVQVLFTGDAVPESISPFESVLLTANAAGPWAGCNTATTEWDPVRQGWVATFLMSGYLNPRVTYAPRVQVDSTGFADAPGDQTLRVSVINSWSFDGATVYTGPMYVSGTAVASYE